MGIEDISDIKTIGIADDGVQTWDHSARSYLLLGKHRKAIVGLPNVSKNTRATPCKI